MVKHMNSKQINDIPFVLDHLQEFSWRGRRRNQRRRSPWAAA